MSHGWVCSNCSAAGIEQVQPEEATRCALCEEPRYRKTALKAQAVVTSLSRRASGVYSLSGSSSHQASQLSDVNSQLSVYDLHGSWSLDSPAAAAAEQPRIVEDLNEAKSSFGEESARWKQVGDGIVIDLFFRPFEHGRPESLPAEACKAWGLKRVFALDRDVDSAEVQQVREETGKLLAQWILGRTQKQMEDKLRGLFALFDTDDSNAIDRAEFGQIAKALGMGLSSDMVSMFFDDLDADGSGTISFEELRHAFWKYAKKPCDRGCAECARKQAASEARAARLLMLSPSKLMLRLVFESASAYHSRSLENAQLFFVRDDTPTAPGDQRDAHDNGCRVAKQLLSIASGFFGKASSPEQELGRLEKEKEQDEQAHVGPLKAELRAAGGVTPAAQEADGGCDQHSAGQHKKQKGGATSTSQAVAAGTAEEEKIVQLCAMGFEPGQAHAALERSSWCVEAALESCLASTGQGAARCAHDHEAALEEEGMGTGSEFRRSDSRALRRKEAEAYKGVMAQTYSYLAARLQTLNEYCAICDAPHTFGSMMQPSVCTRTLCAFRFVEFGRLIVDAGGLAAHAEVLDLLVATSTLAAQSTRAELIFDPFPSVAAEPGSDELALDPAKKQAHLPIVREVLSKFPAFEQINAHALESGARGLQTLMQERHPLCHPLFEWIRTSNRAHLESVPSRLQLARVGTRHQFVMLSAPPERQARFDELKAKHSTTFAWHGSSPENWHGILRYGLKNASNTALQKNGASYGSGIYLSPEGTMSMGYSGMAFGGGFGFGGGYGGHGGSGLSAGRKTGQQGTPASEGGASQDAHSVANTFLDSPNLRLLALCEVALVPSLRKSGSIWVAPEEESVVTRFLFAYPQGAQQAESQLNSQAPDFEEEVRACLSKLATLHGDSP